MSIASPFEPLVESAPLAWADAPTLCFTDAEGRSCAWYHQVWQYLRLLGVISSVRTNTDFLVNAFRDAPGEGKSLKALISGSADYSLLAHLKQACDLDHRQLDVTVVDRCPTPLRLNDWYGGRVGMTVDTRRADVLDFAVERPVDLIATHNFMGRFDAHGRRRLVARWSAWLKPGGRVVTTQRIRPNSERTEARYSESEARELSQRVGDLARTHDAIGVDPVELAAAVYTYAIRKGAYVIRTDREILDPLLEQGFEIVQADEAGSSERLRDRPSSSAGTDTYRLRVIARKR
jgi:hypothetical protein